MRMRVHEWEGLGVHTRQYVRAGERVCALNLARMIGFSVLPLSPNFPEVRRWENEIYVDFSLLIRDGSLIDVREQVVRELAEFLLEECDYVRNEGAIVGVATELVFPYREAERAWRHYDGDLEQLDDYYADHVPARWMSTTLHSFIHSQVVTLYLRR